MNEKEKVVRRMIDNGASLGEMAKLFDVSSTAMSKYLSRRGWKTVHQRGLERVQKERAKLSN
jgi:predicted transcriptional regulator